MATTTAEQGFPIPDETDTPDVPRDITNLAEAVEKKVMGTYASATDRDAKITSPQEGQFAYCESEDLVFRYHNNAWAQWPPAQPAITYGSSVPANTSGNDGDVFFQI